MTTVNYYKLSIQHVREHVGLFFPPQRSTKFKKGSILAFRFFTFRKQPFLFYLRGMCSRTSYRNDRMHSTVTIDFRVSRNTFRYIIPLMKESSFVA